MKKLVTLNGECFEAEFEGKERAADRDGIYYRFRLKDAVRNRGELLLSVFRFGPKELLDPNYDGRIESVRLNAIRRAFDNGTLSFDRPPTRHQYQLLPLSPNDFKPQSAVGEDEIRQFITHKAYWLSYRGTAGGRFPVQFDEPADLEYLGVSADDVIRNVYLLGEMGLLGKTEIAGMARPSATLIQRYESSRGKAVLRGSMENAAITKPVQMDDLLRIPLRGSLDEDLGKLGAASKKEFFPLSVLMIDLDGFKPVNDTYGHKIGDEVLKEVTSTIKAVCKGKAQLYRYGGDEFVVVLPNYNLREAEGIADRLRETVAQTPLPNCPLTVTASIGVASFRETCQEINLLLEEADHAMYAAKDAGGNCVSLAKAPAEASAQSNAPARPTRSDITSRVETAELWMSLQQGYHPHFILLVENKSGDEINIESIALKRGNLYLCEPSKPKTSDELVIPARSKRQISSWTPPVSPTHTLQMKEPYLKDGQPIELDIVVRGKILGRLKTFSHTILATVDYLNQRITQFGG